MTDKQIIIDYENLCENKSKEVGCYNTFDGSCIKEQCFTYRLLQLLKTKEQEYEELKSDLTDLSKIIDCKNGTILTFKEQLDQLKAENEKLREKLFQVADIIEPLHSELPEDRIIGEIFLIVNDCSNKKVNPYKQTLSEIKEIAKNSCCLQPTSTCEEYKNCNECSRTSDDVTVKQILQKISEVEK